MPLGRLWPKLPGVTRERGAVTSELGQKAAAVVGKLMAKPVYPNNRCRSGASSNLVGRFLGSIFISTLALLRSPSRSCGGGLGWGKAAYAGARAFRSR